MAIFNKAYPLVPATENTLRVKGVSKPAENRAAQLLVKGIYVYIFLLIFEGALRKWVLTGLAGPLLLVRDPIALWMVIYAQYKRLVPPSPYLLGMVIIGTLGIITAMIFGHGNIFVAIYGARILLIHFPVIFVMGNVLTRDELIKNL